MAHRPLDTLDAQGERGAAVPMIGAVAKPGQNGVLMMFDGGLFEIPAATAAALRDALSVALTVLAGEQDAQAASAADLTAEAAR